MNYLIELGIKPETISEIDYIYNDIIKQDLIVCEKEVTEGINYFKELGINNIDELLIELPDFFNCGKDKLQKKVNHIGKDKVIQNLNDDIYNAIYLF